MNKHKYYIFLFFSYFITACSQNPVYRCEKLGTCPSIGRVEPQVVRGSQAETCTNHSLDDFTGYYNNRGSRRVPFLSHVLWRNDSHVTTEMHEKIRKIKLSIDDESKVNATAYTDNKIIVSRPINANIIIDRNDLHVYSDTSFLQNEGDLMVGPRSIKVTLTLTCKKHLRLLKHESAAGLLLMIIPIMGSSDSQVDFYRFNEQYQRN